MDKDLLSIASARAAARACRAAFEEIRRFDQESVDRITFAAVEAGYAAAERLARIAVEETGIGRVDGKTAKNRFATRGLWQAIRGMRTCGIVREDPARGIIEVADPFGVVAAVIPTTNPTSTALFKAIICLKSRNAMVASPHPRAARCIRESIEVCREAAEAAGAPPGVLACMTEVTLEGTQALMKDREVDLILATGGSALVRAAYSSGKPAFGVGPGNVPAYVDRSADVENAARCLVESQTFDNGTICSSEQAVVCDRPVADRLLDALRRRGVHVCSPEEVRKLEAAAIRDGVTNPAIVGLAAHQVARLAGFTVPESATVLIAPYEQVGREHPLSLEKLCPLLAYYRVDGHEEGCRLCLRILDLGGRGHTLGIHCEDEAIIRAFAIEKPVNRLIVNSPTAQGAVGYATALFPSMTLGCGSFGGNITSDNVGPQHLLNIKRAARVLPAWREGRFTGDFERLPPLGAGEEGTPVRGPWEAVVTATAPAAAGGNPAASGRSFRWPREVDPARRLPGELHGAAELEAIIEGALERRRAARRGEGRSAPPGTGGGDRPPGDSEGRNP